MSISAALAMVFLGAKGNTAAQMEKVSSSMHWETFIFLSLLFTWLLEIMSQLYMRISQEVALAKDLAKLYLLHHDFCHLPMELD